MTETIKRELKTITNAITNNTEAVAIYLFDSYAYGKPHKDSDLDIHPIRMLIRSKISLKSKGNPTARLSPNYGEE